VAAYIHDLFSDAMIPFLDPCPSLGDPLSVRIVEDISKAELTTLLNTTFHTTVFHLHESPKLILLAKHTAGGIQAAANLVWKISHHQFHLVTSSLPPHNALPCRTDRLMHCHIYIERPFKKDVRLNFRYAQVPG
jgi:hypothetical protein